MEYRNIKVKADVLDTLKETTDMLNHYNKNKGNPKATVAGLVTMLADAYRTQMDHTTLMYNDIAWSLSGVPVILNGDSAKHYQELKHYQPETCVIEVNSFIRERAMEERFESILKDKEDEQ
jgi:hypothetical protein